MPDKAKPRSKNQLLDDLKTEQDPIEKKNIRAKLRKMGHDGGLGLPRTGPGKKAKSKGKGDKKKGKRALSLD